MHSELLKYVVIVGSSGVLSLALSLYGAFKIRDSPRVKHYVILTFLSSVFAFGYMFEMMSTSIEEVKFWLSVEYLPLPFIPAFIVLMCFNYVGKKIYPAFYYLLFRGTTSKSEKNHPKQISTKNEPDVTPLRVN
ncbi:hypothetical protein MHL30_12305 [Priestia flexa]|uniref:histidine kinase N-terminal 7TM domain-containing protein n=1 Tax=Priestia flexa TaxID=86664 RepID=UPI001EF6AD48|nr:histidine kinase N-terminal 7TM domain-containing protein [Priestia flexa]MCG7313962.1 hypothetical protein [Priestia flexa]